MRRAWAWMLRLLAALLDLDRRWIYLLTLVSLSLPVLLRFELTPPRLPAAEELFDFVEELSKRSEEGKGRSAVLVSFDWGPQTKAELEPISVALLKHLMYKRVPVVVITLFQPGAPMTRSVPRKAASALVKVDGAGNPVPGTEGRDEKGEKVSYGTHWVNVGYRPGWSDAIRALASDFRGNIRSDAEEDKPLETFPMTRGIADADGFGLMVEVTGLVGAFDGWLQFFKKKETMPFGLGCTSVSIPENYVYMDSGRLKGLFEGIAGAAAYERLLYERYGLRPSSEAYGAMTAQIFGQGLIVLLVLLGNAAWLAARHREGKRE